MIKVLEDAREIEERKLIEDIYGVDLSKCKVIVTEFKLPLDYAWSPESLPIKVESGGAFWLGFFIDDNDTPGSDVQNLPRPRRFRHMEIRSRGRGRFSNDRCLTLYIDVR